MKCDIGHFEIKAEGRCYNLVPSFENIMKLGDESELIDIYNYMHGLHEQPQYNCAINDLYMYLISLSAEIIRACSDIDPSRMLIDIVERNGKSKMKIGVGKKLTPERQIILAAGLVRHGIAGVIPEKTKTSDSKAATKINLWEFVHVLMGEKFRMSKSDALSLTMTEFAKLMHTNYPPEKTAVDVISDEEYDDAMANLAKINKIRDVH